MANLLSLAFWFKLSPGPLISVYQNILISFIIFLIILALLAYLKQKKTGESKKFVLAVWREIYIFALTNIFIGALLFFFCYQDISFFSSRFWFLLWILEMAIKLFFIFNLYKEIPQKIIQAEKQEEYQKYIPHAR